MTQALDFEIEIKENDAKITFDNIRKVYLVKVSDPIDFSRKISNAVLKYYKETGDIDKFNKLKQFGFNYRTYPRTRIL
jgi:hypothetical protein